MAYLMAYQERNRLEIHGKLEWATSTCEWPQDRVPDVSRSALRREQSNDRATQRPHRRPRYQTSRHVITRRNVATRGPTGGPGRGPIRCSCRLPTPEQSLLGLGLTVLSLTKFSPRHGAGGRDGTVASLRRMGHCEKPRRRGSIHVESRIASQCIIVRQSRIKERRRESWLQGALSRRCRARLQRGADGADWAPAVAARGGVDSQQISGGNGALELSVG